ncbi:MAG: isopentenyl-diphosphate delta-isomerase [Bacteroidota bacterium]
MDRLLAYGKPFRGICVPPDMANFVSQPTAIKKLDYPQDPTASSRKHDHIDLAFRSQVSGGELDQRFYYEPLLAAHPAPGSLPVTDFLGKQLRAPLWVSSMTGGTEMALTINRNLARACAEFGMGMGLGSCRSLLYETKRLEDFNMRPIIGSDQPLYGNLGLAQVEQLIRDQELYRIDQLVEVLDIDGLIVHVNPLQEWLQPEGDRFLEHPIATLESLLAHYPTLPIIVKEVGQGMGPASLRALFALPLAAIDTAASGGTNFSKLELLRSNPASQEAYMPIARIGHLAVEMTDFVNEIVADPMADIACRQLIISGGLKSFLDGYYLTERVQLPAIYGMASAFLKYAQRDYDTLADFVSGQIRGLELAHAYLSIR